MNKKNIYGVAGVIIGLILFILIVDLVSKPANESLSFSPAESFETFFFSFVYTMGDIGYFVGSIVLFGILVSFYYLATLVYKFTVLPNKKSPRR